MDANKHSGEEHLTKPTVFGPGTWFCIHILARKAYGEKRRDEYQNIVMIILSSLPCNTCRQHALDYIANNPISKAPYKANDNGEDLTLFHWTWLFHNAVNRRLGKSQMSWDKAVALYGEEGVCMSGCGDKSNTQETVSMVTPKGRPLTVQNTVPQLSSRPITFSNVARYK